MSAMVVWRFYYHIGALSGFDGLQMNKFKLHFYNLRHLQHHIGPLAESMHLTSFNKIDLIEIAQ